MKTINGSRISGAILIIIFIVVFILNAIWYVSIKADNTNLTSKMKFNYLTYKEISTSIDERNRLVIINYTDNTVTIFSDSVTLGVQAQISTYIYKDYLNTKNKK